MNTKEKNKIIQRYKKIFDEDVRRGNYLSASSQVVALAYLFINEKVHSTSPIYEITMQNEINKAVKKFVGFRFNKRRKLFYALLAYEVSKFNLK